MAVLPAPMATLPAPKAMVNVGPPLSCRGPRLISADVFVVAQALVVVEISSVTILLVEAGIITVPLPS